MMRTGLLGFRPFLIAIVLALASVGTAGWHPLHADPAPAAAAPAAPSVVRMSRADLESLIDTRIQAKRDAQDPAEDEDEDNEEVPEGDEGDGEPPAQRAKPKAKKKGLRGAEPPARTDDLPAVHGDPDADDEPDAGAERAAAARSEMGFGGRYRYPNRFRGSERNLRTNVLVRQWAPGDRAVVDIVCKLHFLLATGDKAGARQMLKKARALSETSGSAGGFTVPDEFAQDVIAKMGEVTPLATREFLRIVPMGTDVKKVPVLTTRPDVSALAENSTGEGGTDPAFGEVELVARKFGRVLPISVDLVEDSSIAVIEYLRDLYAEILGEKRNTLITNGSGGGEPEGVRMNANVPTKAFSGTQTLASDNLAFINGIFHKLKAKYRGNAIWLMTNAMIEKLSNLADTTGRPLLINIADEPFQRLKGKPVFENNAIPDNLGGGTNESEIIFGNFKEFYVFGDRMQMTVATDQGGQYFRDDQVALKVKEKYDGRVGQPEAFVRGTGKQVS